MKRYLPYLSLLRPVRWHFLAGVLAGLVYAIASGAGLPLVIKGVLPIVFSEEGSESGSFYLWLREWLGDVEKSKLVFYTCLWIPAVFILRSLGGYFNVYLINYCGFKVLEQIRVKMFAHIQSLPLSFFQKHQSGDLLARQSGDAELLRQIVAQVSNDLIKQPATLLAAVGYLVYQGFQNQGMFVVLIALLSVPLCVLPIRLASRNLKKRSALVQKEAGAISALVAENLQAPLEVRSYNLQESYTKRFLKRTREFLHQSVKVIKYRTMISPAIEVVAAVGFSLSLYYAWKIGGMKQGDFIALGMALYMAYEPVKKLGTMFGIMRQGEAALDRIEAILNTKNDLEEPAKPRRPERVDGVVRFEGVSFAYGEEPVLKKVDLAIAKGECVAFIGASGAGKTTCANLIPRFFDVTEGSVTVDGVDVRDWAKRELRNEIAVVSQMPVLFSGSIRENILLGRPDATDEEVIAAAQKAYAHGFITTLPDGYETSVAEGGSSLSGGQRQRIALARAFLKNAPILILDEATSALDRESEARIQEALAELIRGRTTIIIAHRLSTTKIADRVLEFDRGELVGETGSATSLDEREG